MSISWRRPSEEALRRLLAGVASQPPTYRELGATKDSKYPSGYHQGRHTILLGQGADTFQIGREALRSWQAHRGAGTSLVPSNPELIPGGDVVATYRIGILLVMAPCRIIYVTDDERSFGFAYGTLPSHPESGEEAFHVHMDQRGAVTFEVSFFARTVSPLARLGGPVSWFLQRRMTRRYLHGVAAFAEARRTT